MFNNLDYIIIAAFFVVLLLIPAITAIRSKEKDAVVAHRLFHGRRYHQYKQCQPLY